MANVPDTPAHRMKFFMLAEIIGPDRTGWSAKVDGGGGGGGSALILKEHRTCTLKITEVKRTQSI
jgi:hypothetical protein